MHEFPGYPDFFRRATGRAPYPYQERLAAGAPAVLSIPTGLGKTEATVIAWLYRRLTDPVNTPRRLLYCLPSRALVEQTYTRITSCLENLVVAGIERPTVEIVMGGDVGEQWYRHPERMSVVIGTQDMLLSRALNRGYGMSRFQWPMTFAAANDDVYWVIDEVQLQGIGAVTAAQLQAFRAQLGTFHATELTLASATIDTAWFETADVSLLDAQVVALGDDDLQTPTVARILGAHKTIERAEALSDKEVAELVLQRHRPGTRTIVVVNRVARAQDVYRSLKRLDGEAGVVLLHSRFRPPERERHTREALQDVDPLGPGLIVVATQVLEAGVDISAATLVTDVAPWASLVQRFGRCNRRGEVDDAACIWIDAGEPKKADAAPYDLSDLIEARQLLGELEGTSAAPGDLPKQSIPLRGGLVIRKPEFLDLFDTSPDLGGHDVDVAPYIREGDEMSVSLFWREEPPQGADDLPAGPELCAAPMSRVREIVKALRATGHGTDARLGNQFARADEPWTPLHENEVRPGIMVWLRSDVGWYDDELGFGKHAQRVSPVDCDRSRDFSESCPAADSDGLSEGMPRAITLTQHAQDTWRHGQRLAAQVKLPARLVNVVATAALWHDAGKAHPVFQETMRRANVGVTDDAAVWAKGIRNEHHRRRGFRHELPGALAYLSAHGDEPDADAIAFLIAAHHGKLRIAAQQWPFEAPEQRFSLLGNREGDEVPSVDLGGGVCVPGVTISLMPFRVGMEGEERAWVDRTIGLRDDASMGPFRLAYMELLVRLADWRASADEQREVVA